MSLAAQMGKGDRKKRFKELAKLAPVPRKKKRGRIRMDELENDRLQATETLRVRARMMGRNPDDAEALKEMREQALGEPAGMAIFLAHKNAQAKALWDVYAALTASEARYCRRILGMSLDAACARLEMTPERMEASASDTIDLRDPEAKDAAAIRSWTQWRGRIGQLNSYEQTDLFNVIRGRKPPIEPRIFTGEQPKLTEAGTRFLAALEKLAEMA